MKIMRKIVKKFRTIPFYFSKIKKISQKDIREIWQANFNTDGNASELIKNITELSSSTVYLHYQSLIEKGT